SDYNVVFYRYHRPLLISVDCPPTTRRCCYLVAIPGHVLGIYTSNNHFEVRLQRGLLPVSRAVINIALTVRQLHAGAAIWWRSLVTCYVSIPVIITLKSDYNVVFYRYHRPLLISS
ncbi:hypothetical protein J6590_056878, partial [Homalodisca vitripennis]